MNEMSRIIPNAIPEIISIASSHAILAGRLYLPPNAPRAVAVLHGAVGVPQLSYRHFAAWLAAERGMACLTYDYRDFGGSATASMRKSRATLTEWGLKDQTAALDAAETRFPGLPLWVIGHSFGGAMLPFHRPRTIERAIVLTAGLVHMSDHPWPYQGLARQFWHVSGPISTLAMGYLPGRRIGFGSDLPAGVFWQWRRWCIRKGFYLNDIGTHLPEMNSAAHSGPTRMIAVADDVMVPPLASKRMLELMPGSSKELSVLRPDRFGLRRIGHLGVFERGNAVLWPAVVD